MLVVVGFEVPLDFKQRTKQGEANKRKSTVDCREREREREREGLVRVRVRVSVRVFEMVRWGFNSEESKGGHMERKSDYQSNIWERRTEVDRHGFIKRIGTKESLEREGISGLLG